MRLRVPFILLALVALCGIARAQTPVSYTANYYNVGASSPVQSETFQPAAASCNQAAPAATSNVNPTRIVWDDPANTGKVCIYSEASAGPLFSVPMGNYEGALLVTTTAGPSPESVRAPFSRQPLPAAPANFKVVR